MESPEPEIHVVDPDTMFLEEAIETKRIDPALAEVTLYTTGETIPLQVALDRRDVYMCSLISVTGKNTLDLLNSECEEVDDSDCFDAIKVLVTGAAGQIAYSLLYSVAKGDVFGSNQKISLVLLDIQPMAQVLEGVVLELQDCALPLLEEVIATTDENVAFKDIDAALLVGAMPRRQGMERKDLLAANVKIFKSQGSALDKLAKKTVKVLVVGNPANTNAFICSHFAPSIPKENFSALTRLDQNRAQAQIAMKTGVGAKDVSNVIIWGNHSSTQFPDASHAVVLKDSQAVPAPAAVGDDAWLATDFLQTVQKRGGKVIELRKLSSAMSAAKAICDHMRDWWFGTKVDQWVSMAVISDGSYDIPAGIMYSFPLQIEEKQWKIVQGLSISDFAREKMNATLKELEEEKAEALKACEGAA